MRIHNDALTVPQSVKEKFKPLRNQIQTNAILIRNQKKGSVMFEMHRGTVAPNNVSGDQPRDQPAREGRVKMEYIQLPSLTLPLRSMHPNCI